MRRGPRKAIWCLSRGHPGRTSRLLTVAELEYQRDVQYPNTLQYLNGAEVALTAYSARSSENARRAKDTLYGFMNSRKARLGAYEALLSSELMERKRAAEEKLRVGKTIEAFERIAAAQKVIGENVVRPFPFRLRIDCAHEPSCVA